MTAATMSAATAMEPATSAAVESATAAEVGAAAATESASSAASKAATAASCKSTASVEAAATKSAASETATTVKPAPEAAASEEVSATEAPTTEPWAGADEEAAYEPVRAVVAVRSAGVRSIAVITVGADRSGTVVIRANADTDGKLCIGVGRRQKHKTKTSTNKCKIFEISHFLASRRARYLFRCGPLVPGLPFF